MKLVVAATEAEAADRAAEVLARAAQAAVTRRGRFVLGLSGGRGPGPLFEALACRPLPWEAIHLVQVDERIAPDGDPARNLGLIEASFEPVLDRLGGLHPVPVDPDDPPGSAERYRRSLVAVAGDPPVLDAVHLGLGPDGHTASLVPGDPVVGVADRPVALTGPYQGHRRITLTRGVLDDARLRLWFVLDEAKRPALARLLRHDAGIPAGLVRSDRSTVVTTRAVLGLGTAATRR